MDFIEITDINGRKVIINKARIDFACQVDGNILIRTDRNQIFVNYSWNAVKAALGVS